MRADPEREHSAHRRADRVTAMTMLAHQDLHERGGAVISSRFQDMAIGVCTMCGLELMYEEGTHDGGLTHDTPPGR